MRKSGGFFFAIAALIVSGIIWGNPVYRLMSALSLSSPPPSVSFITPSSPISSDPTTAPIALSVDEVQLTAHVNALAQPRFTTAQKETARRYIAEQLMSYELMPEEQPYELAGTGGVNIVATLLGQDTATESIVLGAHYDTTETSPGADDNGSGIATLLEAARIFSSTPLNARTLKLVFFDQEEYQREAGTGLLGSLAFAENEQNMAGLKAAVILDMIGYACRTPGCQSYPGGLPLPDVPDTGDFLAVLALRSVDATTIDPIKAFVLSSQRTWPLVFNLPVPRAMLKIFPDLLRSDHAAFWERGIPTGFVTDTANFRNPNYHTPQDTIDTLDLSFFKGSAQHVVNAIATLLNQP